MMIKQFLRQVPLLEKSLETWEKSIILEGTKIKKPSARAQGLAIQVKGLEIELEKLPGMSMAFSILQSVNRRTHRSDLPPSPEYFHELKNHPHAEGFQEATLLEFNNLRDRQAFREVDRPAGKQVIPVSWVFTYKFDSDGYLLKYKAKLVVRGDLQIRTFEDTRAATLALRVFRLLMAIMTVFDLDTEHPDALNAFINSLIDKEAYIQYPPGVPRSAKVFMLLRTLYGLRRSPMLLAARIRKNAYRTRPYKVL